MLKKILITGASGFVGSFLVEEALKRSYLCYAGVRKSSNLQYLKQSEIAFFRCDFTSKESIKKELLKYDTFDYIIHNAGITKSCNKKDFDKVNYEYTKNFIDAIKESQKLSKKFVYISSLAAQGPGEKNSNKPISISNLPKPKSAYGHSKLKAEKYLQASGLDYLIFRPTGVYGPREQDYLQVYKSIKMGIETFIGTRQQHISFIYVKDLSRLIFDAIKSDIVNRSYLVSDLQNHTTESFNK